MTVCGHNLLISSSIPWFDQFPIKLIYVHEVCLNISAISSHFIACVVSLFSVILPKWFCETTHKRETVFFFFTIFKSLVVYSCLMESFWDWILKTDGWKKKKSSFILMIVSACVLLMCPSSCSTGSSFPFCLTGTNSPHSPWPLRLFLFCSISLHFFFYFFPCVWVLLPLCHLSSSCSSLIQFVFLHFNCMCLVSVLLCFFLIEATYFS